MYMYCKILEIIPTGIFKNNPRKLTTMFLNDFTVTVLEIDIIIAINYDGQCKYTYYK